MRSYTLTKLSNLLYWDFADDQNFIEMFEELLLNLLIYRKNIVKLSGIIPINLKLSQSKSKSLHDTMYVF